MHLSYRSVNHNCYTRCAYQEQLTLSRCNPVYSRTTVKATRSSHHDSHFPHPVLFTFPGLLCCPPALCLPFISSYLAGNCPAPGGSSPVLHPGALEAEPLLNPYYNYPPANLTFAPKLSHNYACTVQSICEHNPSYMTCYLVGTEYIKTFLVNR